MVFAKGHVWVHGPPNLPFAASHFTERNVHLELVSWSQLSTVPSLHPASILTIPIFHDVCELGTSVCPLFILRVDTAPFTAQGLLKRVCWVPQGRFTSQGSIPNVTSRWRRGFHCCCCCCCLCLGLKIENLRTGVPALWQRDTSLCDLCLFGERTDSLWVSFPEGSQESPSFQMLQRTDREGNPYKPKPEWDYLGL